MKRTTFILLLFMVVTFVGCQTISPRAELRIAQVAFTGIVESLTELQKAGQIGEDERIVIGDLVHTGAALLDQWANSVLETGQRPAAADQFGKILTELTEWELLKKGGD